MPSKLVKPLFLYWMFSLCISVNILTQFHCFLTERFKLWFHNDIIILIYLFVLSLCMAIRLQHQIEISLLIILLDNIFKYIFIWDYNGMFSKCIYLYFVWILFSSSQWIYYLLYSLDLVWNVFMFSVWLFFVLLLYKAVSNKAST